MCEADVYKKYLGEYKCKEKTRNANRNQRGGLTQGWKPDNLRGRSILVIGENGVGDEVLTSSCLSDLNCKCESISWQCDPKLEKLFTRSFPKASFISQDGLQPTTDGTIYSFELIGRFRETLDSFPCEIGKPYLQTSISLKNTLAKRYCDDSKKLVGLAWRSERDGETLSDKTCSLRDEPAWTHFFSDLKEDGKKFRFVSLQYGDTADEIAFARWKYGVEIYQDKSVDIFNDVDAAAAQIAAMDYIVSISTMTAHLAGALGKKGCVLLQKHPFPHWRAGEKRCPWYPSLALIKQDKKGKWGRALGDAAKKVSADA